MRYPQIFLDDLRRQTDIVRVISDYVALKKKGANWMACCPFHQEKSPSFSVNPAKDIFYCFGCLEESELIWTRRGLKPIGEVQVGEQVLDKHGDWQEVLNIMHKPTDVLLGFSTAAFRHDPLWLTPDHICIFAKRSHVIESVPYVFATAERSIKFLNAKKHTRRIGKYRDKLKLTEGHADTLEVGDYMVFPVVPESARRALDLSAHCINPRENRINGIRIKALPVNERTAWLYGLWLAEGSTGRGFARWTFHAKEKNTLAAKTVTILKGEFGLSASVYEYAERPNTCEVSCSKTDLACQLTHWFGKGAAHKRLPAEALYWPVNIQKAFLSGYRDGDGDCNRGTSTSVSRQLSYGIFALAIQAQENIALYHNEAYIDKAGLQHKECWRRYPRGRESSNGFYEIVGDTTYYFSPIIAIEHSTEPKQVVDITVSNTSSFVTKLGAVHNCGRGGSVFSFVMEMERLSFPEAVRVVAEKAGVPLPAMENEDRYVARKSEAESVIKLNSWALEWWEEQYALMDSGEAQTARDYIMGRGITDETRAVFRLGYAPDRWDGLGAHLERRGATKAEIERSGLVVTKERGGFYDRFRARVIFPVFDAQGRPVAFGGRTLEPHGEPKYLNSPETPAYVKGRHLFGLNLTREEIKRKRFAILVEGYLDLIVPYQYGVTNMVASLGTALTPEQAKLLGRFARKLVVNYDGDRAGVAAAKRALEALLTEDFEVKVLVLPDGDDPDEFIKAHGIAAYHERRGKALPHLQFVLDQATQNRNLLRPAEKAQAVEEVLPSVRAVRNPIQQREYFDIAMDTLRVDDAALRTELWRSMKSAQAETGAFKQKIARYAAAHLKPTVAEQQLLELLVHDEELRREILPRLEETDYEALATGAIFAALKKINTDGLPFDFDTLKEMTGGDAVAEDYIPLLLLSEPQRAEGEAADDFRGKAEKCIATLRSISIDHRLRELMSASAEAKRVGDADAIEQFTRQQFELERAQRRNQVVPPVNTTMTNGGDSY